MRNFSIGLMVAVLSAGIGLTASAATISPVAPSWARGSAYTTYQAWDVFSAAGGPNAPNTPGSGAQVDAAPFNPNGTANAFDSSGQSSVLGSGNIYTPSAVEHINVLVPDYGLGTGYVTTVLFQTRTQGSEPDYSTIHLTYTDGGGTHVLSAAAGAETNRQALGGFGGFLVEHASLFNVPGSIGTFTVDFFAADTSMSFDRVVVDTITTRAAAGSPLLPQMNATLGNVVQAVPEPASLAGMALAGAALLRRRRRTA